MAKTGQKEVITNADVAEVDAAALVRQETPGALATVPQDLIADSGKGTENITAEDVRPPRLLICQANSPQRERKRTDKSIAGLDEPMMFNDLSEEIYGEGPLKFVVVSRLGVRGIEFAPQTEGGGVRDFNVPLDDPRMQFTADPEDPKKRKKPVATKFVDYLIFLVDTQELVALSLKGGQLKVATTIDSLIAYPLKIGATLIPKPPSWARLFSLATQMKNENNYSFGAFVLKQIGVADEQTRATARSLHEVFAKKRVVVAVDASDNDAVAAAGGNSDFENPDGSTKF